MTNPCCGQEDCRCEDHVAVEVVEFERRNDLLVEVERVEDESCQT